MKELNLRGEDMKNLQREFDDGAIQVKIESLNKEKTKALLVAYLNHVSVQKRLDEVDPNWSSEAVSCGQFTDERSGKVKFYSLLRLTVRGVARANAGEGNSPKAAVSSALKRCAMNFGVGRSLYEGSRKWVDYNEQKDRYRTWTLAEYRGASGSDGKSATRAQLRVADQKPKEEDLGLFVPIFGPLKGCQLNEVTEEELADQVEALQSQPLGKRGRELLDKITRYLASKEN